MSINISFPVNSRLNVYIQGEISLRREGILGVICSFKYSTVEPFILEGEVGKTKYSRKVFAEERPQKHQGKEIQAKLLVTEKNE